MCTIPDAMMVQGGNWRGGQIVCHRYILLLAAMLKGVCFITTVMMMMMIRLLKRGRWKG